MSKVDRLTNEHPEYSINFIELLSHFDPSDSNKFMPFLIKQMDNVFNDMNIDSETQDIVQSLVPNTTKVDQFLLRFIIHTFGRDNLFMLWEFHKHLNENRIAKNDVQQYKSWEEIINAVHLAELKLKEKEYRKQILPLYDNGEWIVLKPLSYESSLTYGAGTKWCTASKNQSSYFYDYASRGVLVYAINRKHGDKFAMFVELHSNNKMDKRLNKTYDISFWSAEDIRTESMALGIPEEIMSVLRKEINDKTKLKPNKYFFGKDELVKLNKTRDLRTAEADMPVNEPVGEMMMEEEVTPIEGYAEAEGVAEEPLNDVDINAVVDMLDNAEMIALEDDDEYEEDAVVAQVPMNDVRIEQLRQRLHGENINVEQEVNEFLQAGINNGRIIRDMINRVEMREEDNIEERQDEAVLDPAVRQEIINVTTSDKPSAPKRQQYKLGPGIVHVPIGEDFVPASWLTPLEINTVRRLINEVFESKSKSGTNYNRYAFPNGTVIEIIDRIKNGTIIQRTINTIRNGRDEKTPFNPFGSTVLPLNDMPAPMNAPHHDLAVYDEPQDEMEYEEEAIDAPAPINQYAAPMVEPIAEIDLELRNDFQVRPARRNVNQMRGIIQNQGYAAPEQAINGPNNY